MKRLFVSYLVISLLLISGCGSDDSEDRAEAKPSPEELERRRVEHEKYLAEKELIKQQLISASDKELKSMLSFCRDAVEKEADRRNKGPFGIALVDQYSADVYQFGAGSSAIRTDEERIKSFRDFGHEYGHFNTQYAIISAHDSFSGPKNTIDKYSCEIGTELEIVSVSKSY